MRIFNFNLVVFFFNNEFPSKMSLKCYLFKHAQLIFRYTIAVQVQKYRILIVIRGAKQSKQQQTKTISFE